MRLVLKYLIGVSIFAVIMGTAMNLLNGGKNNPEAAYLGAFLGGWAALGLTVSFLKLWNKFPSWFEGEQV